MDEKAEKIALFRYGLIAPLVLETLPRGELTRRAQELAARLYDIPHSTRRQVSVDTLLDWSLRYRRNGLTGLSPKPRQDRGQARAVATETATLMERLKPENPHRTGAALLRELALANEQNQAGLSASTLYRFRRARGLTERQLLLDKATAHKKYEAQFASQIWQSDMLFGPWVGRPGGGKQQVFLQAALDDASRLIPHAQFYPNQGLDAFLDCLRQAIAARGIPTRLYMDNAKSTVPRSWPASPPLSVFSSCIPLPISPKAAARSNASSVLLWSTTEERLCGHCSYTVSSSTFLWICRAANGISKESVSR